MRRGDTLRKQSETGKSQHSQATLQHGLERLRLAPMFPEEFQHHAARIRA
jgi:hypothetical protein